MHLKIIGLRSRHGRYRGSMAEWISVYCRRRVRLDAEAMRRELNAADLWTLAEGLDVGATLRAGVVWVFLLSESTGVGCGVRSLRGLVTG